MLKSIKIEQRKQENCKLNGISEIIKEIREKGKADIRNKRRIMI